MSNKAGVKKVKGAETVGLVPRLRFPEFRGAGEWELASLGKICKRITNGKANSEDHEDGGVYPLFDRSALIKRSNKCAFEAEAVIIPGEGMRFQPRYFRGAFNLHQRAYALMDHSGDARFVYYIIDRYKDALAMKAVQSTVLSLRLPIIEKFAVCVPQLKEQQKIADCLSSLDEVITLESQKLEALKVHKNGLMQQLFPAEGETVPRLRFPEFRGAGGWELKDLEKICDINPPNTGLPDTFYYIDLESVEAGELKTKKKMSRDNAPSRAQRVLQNGDVIYQSVRPYQKNNWFCVFNDDENYVASTGYAQLRAYNSKEFLYQIVHCDDFVGRVIAQCTGSNYPAINSSDLAKIQVAIPRHKEQQKIADCLSFLDEVITLESQKLDMLKTHKKGLMQQLFPKLEEV